MNHRISGRRGRVRLPSSHEEGGQPPGRGWCGVPRELREASAGQTKQRPWLAMNDALLLRLELLLELVDEAPVAALRNELLGA